MLTFILEVGKYNGNSRKIFLNTNELNANELNANKLSANLNISPNLPIKIRCNLYRKNAEYERDSNYFSEEALKQSSYGDEVIAFFRSIARMKFRDITILFPIFHHELEIFTISPHTSNISATVIDSDYLECCEVSQNLKSCNLKSQIGDYDSRNPRRRTLKVYSLFKEVIERNLLASVIPCLETKRYKMMEWETLKIIKSFL